MLFILFGHFCNTFAMRSSNNNQAFYSYLDIVSQKYLKLRNYLQQTNRPTVRYPCPKIIILTCHLICQKCFKLRNYLRKQITSEWITRTTNVNQLNDPSHYLKTKSQNRLSSLYSTLQKYFKLLRLSATIIWTELSSPITSPILISPQSLETNSKQSRQIDRRSVHYP